MKEGPNSMLSILKSEFKSYFDSMIAYILIGLFIFITSVYFYLGNIYNQSAELNGLFGTMGTFLLFIIPILTSRSISEDRKNGMEVLLITSPVRLSDIVLGKYLAVLLVFFVMVGITLIYPIILFGFSQPAIIPLAGGYLGFILLGASMLSFGVFASSLTENQVTASIVSFVGLLIMLITEPLGSAVGGIISKVLNWFSIFSRYDELNRGILGLDTIVYYLSFIAVFLFLTIRVIEKRRWTKSKSLKYGSNSLILIVAVFSIAIFMNLLAEQTGLKFDLTANKLYSIGDTTKAIIGKLDKKVIIYGLLDDGKFSSDQKNVKNLLDKYVNYSKSTIIVKYVDPDKDTKIVNQLDPNGVLDLKKNDFVVTSGNKTKKLTKEDIIQVKVNQESLSQYSTGSLAEQGFTGAIKYVISDKTPTIYFVDGHGEEDLKTNYKTIKENLEKNNYLIKSLILNKVIAVPEDAEILVFLSPKNDLSVSESAKVNSFLQNGGNSAFLFDSIDSDKSFPQFESIISQYNLVLNYDKVKENETEKRALNDPYALILDVNSSKIIPLEFSGMLMLNSRSIDILKNEKQNVEVIPLVKSSASSIGEHTNKSIGKDSKGPLNLAVAVENQVSSRPSKILVTGSTLFLNESSKKLYPPYFATGTYFFVSGINWMQDRSGDILIGAKAYSTGKMGIDYFNSNIVGILVIVVVPTLIMGYGLLVWKKRRNL